MFHNFNNYDMPVYQYFRLLILAAFNCQGKMKNQTCMLACVEVDHNLILFGLVQI